MQTQTSLLVRNPQSCARARSFVLSLSASLYVAGFLNPPQATRVFLTHTHTDTHTHLHKHMRTLANTYAPMRVVFNRFVLLDIYIQPATCRLSVVILYVSPPPNTLSSFLSQMCSQHFYQMCLYTLIGYLNPESCCSKARHRHSSPSHSYFTPIIHQLSPTPTIPPLFLFFVPLAVCVAVVLLLLQFI